MAKKQKTLAVAAAVVVVAVLGCAHLAEAATITWQTPVSASGDGTSDIDNTGTLLCAYQYGTYSGSLTIDGVTFADVADTASGTSITSTGSSTQQGNIGVVPGTTGDYETLLRQNTYQADDRSPWTLHGLTGSNPYLLQAWVADIRYGATQFQAITGGGSTSDNISIRTGQYVIGTFTADGSTQEISFSGDILNAAQVRLIPEPSTLALIGLFGIGFSRRRKR